MTQNVIESWVDAVRDHVSPAADANRDLPHRQAALDLGGETNNLRIMVARGMGDTFNRLPASRWITHWAGYFSPAERNPPVSPLFYDCDSEDVLLVLLNPLQHEATPRTAQEIDTRLGEIATNANFMREMQLFAKVAEFTRADALRDDNFAQRRDRMNGNQPGHLS